MTTNNVTVDELIQRAEEMMLGSPNDAETVSQAEIVSFREAAANLKRERHKHPRSEKAQAYEEAQAQFAQSVTKLLSRQRPPQPK